MFRLRSRNVRNRMGEGALRENNAVGAYRNGFSSGVAARYRPPVWAFVESLRAKRNIADKDMVDIDQGAGDVADKKQESTHDRPGHS